MTTPDVPASPVASGTPIRVELHAEWQGGSVDEELTIERAEWEAMTPAERQSYLEGEAQELLWNSGVSCGYSILGDDEGADVEVSR